MNRSLKTSAPITTLVFDMDGTVLNTLEDLTVSMNYVMGKFELPARTREEYRLFFGNGVKEALRLSLPAGLHRRYWMI